jgi:hypothetical protein
MTPFFSCGCAVLSCFSTFNSSSFSRLFLFFLAYNEKISYRFLQHKYRNCFCFPLFTFGSSVAPEEGTLRIAGVEARVEKCGSKSFSSLLSLRVFGRLAMPLCRMHPSQFATFVESKLEQLGVDITPCMAS